MTDLRWFHRAVVSVVCILVAIELILIGTSGNFLVTPDLSIFVTGIAVVLVIVAFAVWLYRNEPCAESEIPSNSNPGEWTDDGSRRLDSQAKEDVSRDITNITFSGGHDPRVNRPKKD